MIPDVNVQPVVPIDSNLGRFSRVRANNTKHRRVIFGGVRLDMDMDPPAQPESDNSDPEAG